MLKYRRLSKKSQLQSKTQPDEVLTSSEGRCKAQNAQQSLYEISLRADEQVYSSTFSCWPKQFHNESTIESGQTFVVEQGCFSKNLSNINTNTVALNKTYFHEKKKLFQRENQFKKTVKSFQKQSKRKKSCTSINFVLPNSTSTRGHSRIHSSVNMPNANSHINTEPCKQKTTTLVYQMDQIVKTPQKKNQYPKLFSHRYVDRLQTQMTVRKKRVAATYQNIHIQASSEREQSLKSTSYSKYFSILNTLIHEEKKRVIYQMKANSPALKFKGTMKKRSSMCS